VTTKEENLRQKQGKELRANSPQSPDDLEGNDCNKRSKGYHYYVANATETCNPENGPRLINKMQIAPNNVDDSQLLTKLVPNLKEHANPDTTFTNDDFGSPRGNSTFQKQGVDHVQNAICGCNKHLNKLHLTDFIIGFDADGKTLQTTCSQRQAVSVRYSCKEKAFVTDLSVGKSTAYPLTKRWLARPDKCDPQHRLHITEIETFTVARRQHSQVQQQERRNLLAAVELVVSSYKYLFRSGKPTVKGQFRMTCLLIGSATVANIQRIHHYLEINKEDKNQPEITKREQNKSLQVVRDSFLSLIGADFRHQISPDWISGA